jgi:GWxTD domain-containing protein
MRFRSVFCRLIFGLLLVTSAWAKDNLKSLPQRYRDWLTKDVAYIISNHEKDAFLQLPSDDARDLFIDRFWEIRNTTPGSPDNAYKTEHYRRIAYANQYFGLISHSEGWKTDMGRVYITLGEAAQRQRLLGLQKITPMEIWFYSNGNPALPPFFYVIFYQRDPTDEFRLYSPSSDGPERLITAEVGPSRASALKILSDGAGRDVARETLSLLPDEPVDFQSGRVGLQSDVMLGTIKNLANNPISQQALETRRRLLEDVSHRIVLGDEFLDVLTVPLRDPSGTMNLHYVLRLKKPEDFSVGEASKSGYYYSILLSVKVHTADGKPVLDGEKKITHNLSVDDYEQIKGKVFGIEGWLPLPAAKYKIEFQLTNLLRGSAFRKEVEVTVPEVQPEALQVSNVVPFADAKATSQPDLPFSGAGVHFSPVVGQQLELIQGENLNFFYQVWDTAAGKGDLAPKKLTVEYAYGRMGAGDTQTIHDEIPLDQLDSGGSIINGKRIPTGELSPGNYRLAMTVRDPESNAKVFGSLTFSIYPSANRSQAWDVLDDTLLSASKNGIADYQRGLCYLALNDQAKGQADFERAYKKNPADERFRSKLVEFYYRQQQYPRIVDLYSAQPINSATDEQTVLRVAESFEKTGNLLKALAVTEAATQLNPSSGPLFLALADYYRRTGNPQKAAAAEEKGKKAAAPPGS